MNKKGQTTIFLFIGIFIILFAIVALIVVGIVSENINSALDQNITIGSVNLANASAGTIGQLNSMVTGKADFWGISIIFGMVIGLFLSSYLMRNRFPKVGAIADIAIILVSFIISLYLRSIYSDVVIALDSAGQTFATTSLSNTNFFILNLPLFVAIIGVVMMVLFHAGIPRKSEEANVIPEVVTG